MNSRQHHYIVLEPMSPVLPRSNFTNTTNCEWMNTNVRSSIFRESSSVSTTTASASFFVQESNKHQKVWSCSSQQESRKIETIATESSLSSKNHKARSREGGYRKWCHSKLHLLEAFRDKFVLVSYNILGDDNATHHNDLYHRIPPHLMDWSRRRRLICQELDMWKPDVMCFQEVDHFDELVQDFGKKGYSGIFKGRTGQVRDGCAMFWKKDRFRILQEVSVEFKEHDLRDNVAQLCVFELNNNLVTVPGDNRKKQLEANSLQAYNCKKRRVIVGNIHVLFNPKRGDIKLGQVRILLQEARALSEKWDRAPIVIAGDFNSTPQSALYQFLASSKLDLLAHDRREISGQVENVPGSVIGTLKQTTFKPNRYKWYGDELQAATGSSSSTRLRHPLKLFSAYASVQERQGNSRIRDDSGEPLATSYHSKFLGTVDYIWHSKGLIPLRVLDTLPLDVLQQTPGLPTHKWGSDHLSLACQFAFSEDEKGGNSNS